MYPIDGNQPVSREPRNVVGLEPHLALVFPVFSPHVQRISPTFDVNRSITGGGLDPRVLAHDE